MRSTKAATVSLICFTSTGAWAIEPQSIDLAGFDFTPTLLVSQAYDDNFRGLNENEQSSWVTGISPTFMLTAETGASAYRLKYTADSEIYHSYSDATNTDHHLVLDSIMEFTSRHRLDWALAYHRVEETADTADQDENDKYSSSIARAVYGFGAQSAMNQLEFGAHYEARRYHNSGNLNAQEERDSTILHSTWFHRLGARTRSLVEVRYGMHDYVQSSANRDNNDTSLLAGATWDATAKVSGSARLGMQRKDFDSDLRDDYTSPMWEVGLDYKPRTYSIISLNTRQAFDEGDDDAATIRDQTTRLGWEHEWSTRIRTDLDVRYSDREYKASERDDELWSYGVGLTYSPDRWIDVTLGYRFTDNDSTLAIKSYERNIYQLSLNMSL